jgi:D-glucosaminate-specific PTS system IIA component
MSSVRGIIVAHGDMATGVVDAVRAITGIDEEALQPLSNRGLSPETLIEQLRAKIKAGEETIIFTDLQGGSCALAARRLIQQVPGSAAVICGANLPLLLDFAMNREGPVDALVARLVERGRTSIVGTGAAPSSAKP